MKHLFSPLISSPIHRQKYKNKTHRCLVCTFYDVDFVIIIINIYCMVHICMDRFCTMSINWVPNALYMAVETCRRNTFRMATFCYSSVMVFLCLRIHSVDIFQFIIYRCYRNQFMTIVGGKCSKATVAF